MITFPLTALVSLLICLLLLGTGINVGRARVRYGIKAPAVSGHDLFERVDQPLASLERLAAMGGADGDGDGGFAQFQTSDAVHGVLSASVQNVFWGGIGGRGGLPGSAGPGMSRRADFAAGVSLRADSEGRRSRTIRSSARVWRRSSVSASVLLS